MSFSCRQIRAPHMYCIFAVTLRTSWKIIPIISRRAIHTVLIRRSQHTSNTPTVLVFRGRYWLHQSTRVVILTPSGKGIAGSLWSRIVARLLVNNPHYSKVQQRGAKLHLTEIGLCVDLEAIFHPKIGCVATTCCAHYRSLLK